MTDAPDPTDPTLPRPPAVPGGSHVLPLHAVGDAGAAERTQLPSPETPRAYPSGSPLPETHTATPGASARPPAGSASRLLPGLAVGRFAVRALHARGGLGEVFTARDTELNREVALKRIRPHYADDPAANRRFVAEAEITARLDHPGVVPVFGLVADAAGRPSYAMRFIRGASLKDEIDRFYALDKTPGANRNVAFRRLLSRFTAVCQAIAYAHSKRVIHRDIKPANVMVGAFGEVLVVDWGLAKSLDDAPDPAHRDRPTGADGFRPDPEATELPDHLTAVGVAVGTPAFMAPEQAAGDHPRVGPAADIYALGATLYALLTGRAPVTGTANATETLAKVKVGDFPPPRTVVPGVPAALEAVCLKAMAFRLEDRYITAQDLAADVDRWLSDEPVSCYRDPLPARVARWGRRHPARVAAGMTFLLAGLVAAGGVAWAVREGEKATRQEQLHTAQALDEVTRKKGELDVALGQVRAEQALTASALASEKTAKETAVAAEGKAADLFAQTIDTYDLLVKDIGGRLEDRAGLLPLRRELLGVARAKLEKVLIQDGVASGPAARTLALAHISAGDVARSLGDTAAARTEYRKARAVAEKAAAADPAARRELATALGRLAQINLQAGDTAAALEAAETAVKVGRAVAADPKPDADAPARLAFALDRLAAVYLERGNTPLAVAASTESLDIRERIAADPADVQAKRDLAESLDRYADLLLRAGRPADARVAATRGLALRLLAARAAPGRTDVQREAALGYTRAGEAAFEAGDSAAALAAFTAARDALADLHRLDPTEAAVGGDLAAARGRLGYVLVLAGQVADGVTEATAGRDLAVKLAAADQESVKAARTLAAVRERLGQALAQAGRLADARTEFEQAVTERTKLAALDPAAVSLKQDLARGHQFLGDARLAAGDAAGGLDALRKSLALREQVVTADGGTARAVRERAVAHDRLADGHLQAADLPAARQAAEQAYTAFRKLRDDDPTSGQAARDFGIAACKWAVIQAKTGTPTADAAKDAEAGLAAFVALAMAPGAGYQARADVAVGHDRLAELYLAAGEPAKAVGPAGDNLKLRDGLRADGYRHFAAERDYLIALLRASEAALKSNDPDAAGGYAARAAKVPGEFASADLFGGLGAFAARRVEVAAAVKKGYPKPAAVAAYPAVRSDALSDLLDIYRADPGLKPDQKLVRADEAAGLLAGKDASPADLRRAADGYDLCGGWAATPAEKAKYAQKAADARKRATGK